MCQSEGDFSGFGGGDGICKFRVEGQGICFFLGLGDQFRMNGLDFPESRKLPSTMKVDVPYLSDYQRAKQVEEGIDLTLWRDIPVRWSWAPQRNPQRNP